MMGKFVKRYVIRDAETQDEYIHLYYTVKGAIEYIKEEYEVTDKKCGRKRSYEVYDTIEKKVVVHADEIQKVRYKNNEK